jgi:hypothetical protein
MRVRSSKSEPSSGLGSAGPMMHEDMAGLPGAPLRTSLRPLHIESNIATTASGTFSAPVFS